MLMQRISYSLSASGLNPNVLTATPVEWIGKASVIDLWGAAFLAAATDTIALSYTIGGDSRVIIPSGSAINVNAAGPQKAFDGLLEQHPVPLGAHLIMPVTADATAGTHTGRFMFEVRP